jgi:NADH-quinone oxidoreductase subunit N
MNIPTFSSDEFTTLIPTAVLAGAAILLMLTEVFLTSKTRTYQALIATLACGLAGIISLQNAFLPARSVLQGFAVLDPFSSFLTVVVCLGTGLAVMLSAGFLRHRNAERGEFYALLLFSAAGMSLLALSAEFVTLFVNLEVMSIATYALTAYLRRGPRPAEAGFKYFILGAFSAALMLYGAALLYGATGHTDLVGIRAALVAGNLNYGLVLIAVGFAFKIAAVPFHMWTPDVYEGAPTPVTALMSAGVKAAAFVAMVRVFIAIAPAMDPQVPFVMFSALAAATMVIGNLMALPQRNVKRMLAYSSIAHAGYMLMAVAALFAPATASESAGVLSVTPLLGAKVSVSADVYKSLLFYALAYTVTSLGAFGIVGALERREDETRGNTWDLDRFAGLAQRKPAWALAMAAFMLSLGGLPPTIGFMGKLLIFRATVDAGLLGLAILGVLASAAGVYYYLRVVVYMFMRPAADGMPTLERNWTTEVALAVCAIGVVWLGVAPGTVSGWLSRAGMVLGG